MNDDDVDRMEVGAGLDAAVAQHVMGWQVLGHKRAWRPDGCWGLAGDNLDCPERPVYLDHCACDLWEPNMAEFIERLYGFTELCGHRPGCLRVVPCFSREIEPAWQVVEQMKRQSFSFMYFDTAWLSSKPGYYAAFKMGVYPPTERDPDAFRGHGFREQSAPLAIARAALKAALASGREQGKVETGRKE